MDPRRGYIQYRKAIQADIHNGRGAIPLLNNILGLVSQSQAVRPNDYREEDDKIQWDKFMRFEEILSIIQECQARGPVVHGNVDLGFKKIIEETTILSGEDVSPYPYFSLSPRKCGSLADQALWKEVSHWKIAGGQLEGKCLNILQISAFKVGEGQIVSLYLQSVFRLPVRPPSNDGLDDS